MQAEILAKFKPHLDTSTLITNIRNIEKAIRDCLDHFKSTQHMILYYEDIISNSNVLNTIRCPTEKKIHYYVLGLTNINDISCFGHAGIIPGARVPRGPGEEADEPAGENSHEASSGPCQELGGS